MKHTNFQIVILCTVLILNNYCVDIPLINIKGEDGREFQTTNFEDIRLTGIDQSKLNIKPKMPYRVPKELEDQTKFFMINDNIKTKQDFKQYFNQKFKGLKIKQQKQIEDIYQNDTIILNTFDENGRFNKDLIKEQELLIRIQQHDEDDLDRSLEDKINLYNDVFNGNETIESTVINKTKGKIDTLNPLNGVVDQYIKEHRFIEEDLKESKDVHTNDQDIEQSSLGRTPYKAIDISSIWASSVFTQQKKIIEKKKQWNSGKNAFDMIDSSKTVFQRYPTSNINVEGYWLSSGQHKKSDIVSIEVDFERIYKIHYILITWAYAPGHFSVMSSVDKVNFRVELDWQEGIKGGDWRMMAKKNQAFSERYQSYVQHIHFDQPVSAKSIRILVKDNFFQFFGIYRMQLFEKGSYSMVRGKAEGMEGECMVVSDGGGGQSQLQKEKVDNVVMMQDCLDAITLMDGRELFYLDPNFQILSFYGKECVEVKEGKLREKQIVSLGDCSIDSDNRNKWSVDEKGRIKSQMNEEYCIAVVTGIEYSDILLAESEQVTVTGTSSTQDGNHPPQTLKDGDPETYWQSALLETGKQQVTLTISLEREKTAKRIIIEWKYLAKEFQVVVLQASSGLMESIYVQKDNQDTFTSIDFVASNLLGFKIKMVKSDSLNNQEGKGRYAIKTIRLENDNKALRLLKCVNVDDLETNMFYTDDWDYSDIKQKKLLLKEKKILAENSNQLQGLLENSIGLAPQIEKELHKANELKTRMGKIDQKNEILDGQLTNFREKFDISLDRFNILIGEEPLKKGSSDQVGCSSNKPARDCQHIRSVFIYKVSGFYWIKGECQDNPLRVFCDFSLGKGQFYAFVGPLKDGLTLGPVKKITEFQYTCAKIGLQSVEIMNSKQVNVIRQYVLSLGIKLFESFIVAGVDYGCIYKNECSGKYRSLIGETSKDITVELKEQLDPKNIANMGFTNKAVDSIGFTLDQQLMAYFKLGQVDIKGILCSDNTAFTNPNAIIDLTCNTSLRQEPKLITILHTNTKVFCPKNCLSVEGGVVIGSIMYAPKSSICKAAIHAGVLDNNVGGIIYVGTEKGQLQYKGSEKNGVTSVPQSKASDLSFLVNKYVRSCPMDQFTHLKKPSSFLDITNNLMESLQEEEQINKKEVKSMTTEQGISVVMDIHKRELSSLKKYLKMANDAKKLTQLINGAQVSKLMSTDLSGDQLAERLKGIEMHLQGTAGILKTQGKDVNSRLEQTWKALQLEKLKKIKLQRWIAFKDVFDLEVYMIYNVMDNPKGTGKSRWEYTKSSLKGKDKALCQTSKVQYINEDELFGTMILLKYQQFYDQKVTANIMMQSEGSVGIVFRARDEFNFYVAEFKQNEYKRIRRVLAGQSKVLESIQDGGYQQDQWYRVVVTSIQGVIQVHMTPESEVQGRADEDLPMVIQAQDQLLTQGSAGFLTNYHNSFYVEGFQFIPIECKEAPKRSLVLYSPPHCSRYIETFIGNIKLRWLAVPDSNHIGTPIWTHLKNIRGRDDTLSQVARVSAGGSDQPPALFILSFEKYIRDGLFYLSFNAETDGTIGAVFRYQNKDNYYLLEVAGCHSSKFVRVRKVVGGRFFNLHQTKDIGYECDKWQILTVMLSQDKFKFALNNEGDPEQMVFEEAVEDEDFRQGEVGVLAYLAKVNYGLIKIMPFGDKPKEKADPGAPEEEPAFEEIKVQGAMTEKAKKEFQNDQDKTPKWDQCLTYTTKVQRNQHCGQLFGFDVNALEDCQDHYCLVCCSKEVDDLHKVRRFRCQKECAAALKVDQEVSPYKACLDSAHPVRSTMNYCKREFLDEAEQMTCNHGFCDLCCVLIQASGKLNLDDVVVGNCHQDCQNKYGGQEEGEILDETGNKIVVSAETIPQIVVKAVK